MSYKMMNGLYALGSIAVCVCVVLILRECQTWLALLLGVAFLPILADCDRVVMTAIARSFPDSILATRVRENLIFKKDDLSGTDRD